MNLEEMSLRELQNLEKRVAKAIDTYQVRIQREAYAELVERARAMGFTLEELVGDNVPRMAKKSVKPKYRHPHHPELTWSGRGRKPKWFVLALDGGMEERSLLIQ